MSHLVRFTGDDGTVFLMLLLHARHGRPSRQAILPTSYKIQSISALLKSHAVQDIGPGPPGPKSLSMSALGGRLSLTPTLAFGGHVLLCQPLPAALAP